MEHMLLLGLFNLMAVGFNACNFKNPVNAFCAGISTALTAICFITLFHRM